jgi:hypothetical protein
MITMRKDNQRNRFTQQEQPVYAPYLCARISVLTVNTRMIAPMYRKFNNLSSHSLYGCQSIAFAMHRINGFSNR